MEGTELSLQERECKLYNEFDMFTSEKGETIHMYYLRFAQLINDMNTIGMTMQKLQVNTKFVNNLHLEWSKFVTDVKLAKDMHESNFDQLYTYLRQHEVHANKVRLMGERFLDPLALIVNYHHIPSYYNNHQPRGNRNVGTNAANQTRVIRCYNCRGEGHMVRQCTQSKRLRNSEWFKEKILLVQAQESGTDDLDAFDSDCDEAPSARAVLMANLFSYDSDVISEVPISYIFQDNYVLDHCVQEMYYSEHLVFVHTSDIGTTSDSNIISYDQYLKETKSEVVQNFENEIHTLKLRLSKNMENNKTLTTTMDVLKKETKEKEDKYIEEIVDLEKKKKDLDNIVYEVALGYQNPFYLRKAQRIQPALYDGTVLAKKHDVISVIDSEETLILAEDKQAFWFPISKPVSEQLVVQPILVKTDVPHKEPFLENDQLLELIISQDLVHTDVNSYVAIVDYMQMEKSYLDEYNECLELKVELSRKNEMVEKAEFFEINNLKAQLKGKDTTISNLKKHIANLKGNAAADCSESVNNSRVIALGMYKLDLPPLSSTLRKNKEVREDYLKVTKEHANTLHGIVEQDRALEPSDNALNYACKYAQQNQELLVCVNASCPSSQKDSAKPVTAKTKNRNRRVTFEEKRDTSETKTQKQVEPQSKQTTNKPLLPSTGVIGSTSASGSKSKSNTREYRITQAASSNQKNKKVEDHPRIVMSSSNKNNRISICNAIAFQKHTCFVCNLEGDDLLTGLRDTNLYTLSLDDMLKSSPICLLSKASKTKSWLWYRRLSHLNFGTINELAKQGLVRGLPKLKYEKYHLCSACSLGKIKKHTHKPKSKDFIQEKLYLLHMDLCGPMRIESINGKKYILVIVDDYLRFTWVKFLRSKDETLEFIIKFLKKVQVLLNATVRNIRTDNRTEFVNQTLKSYYEDVGISHQTSVARTPQQNDVVER
ncbi:retrovirus-related pol polyprotein from transposon TNT 1-94 [Tanacetum coccineum]